MGTYINPGNEGFKTILRGDYVDKTGLVGLMNSTLDAPGKLVLASRPRRFGKSYAAQMLVAYYSCGCDSRELFEGLEAAKTPRFADNLNGYNVVFLDMATAVQAAGVEGVVAEAARMVLRELRDILPAAGAQDAGYGNELASALVDVVAATGRKFVFVIDEWDAVYRLAKDNDAVQRAYADWLRSLFKSATFTDLAIAGAYLTGILPIKKYAHQSAVSDFREYTMVRPGDYAPYAGFTAEEVDGLCLRYGLQADNLKRWYDGYVLEGAGHVYAPYSVMEACRNGKVGSYWVTTEAYESLRPYIEMDFDGLQEGIVRAIGGASLAVDPDSFQNDMTSIHSADDVLTLLVHLGYLSYDEESGCARVPNEEVRRELARAVMKSRHPKLVELMRQSAQLVDDIVHGREDAAASAFQRAHDKGTTPLFYNDEQALRAVIKEVLIATADEYARIEELPSGRGFADVVYLPKRGVSKPALLVELKWNKPADTAIEQIRERDYPAFLRDLEVPIVLVGVTYDSETKRHACRIETLEA